MSRPFYARSEHQQNRLPTTTPAIMGLFRGIDTIILRVSNLEASTAWYQNILGLDVVFEDPGQRLTVLDAGGPTTLTLWETTEPILPASAFPILKTFDAMQTHSRLQAVGISVGELLEDPGIRYFTFQDPDGNKIETCEVIA